MQYLLRENIDEVKPVEGVSPLLLNILSKRGIKDVNAFLYPSFSMLNSPSLFKNIQNFGTKIVAAVKNERPIIIYGSQDIDGVISAFIIYTGLRQVTTRISYYFSDMKNNGYGFNESSINLFHNKVPGALIVTAGCGMSSKREIKMAQSLGMEVIVIDNHTQYDEKPICPVLNTRADGETYPFKDLCSSAIAMKLIQFLRGSQFIQRFLDLVAIATIASGMPLVDENRVLVHKGLEFINYIKRPGLEALIRQNPASTITSGNLISRYIPVLNAGIKMGSHLDILSLFSAKTADEATPYVAKILEFHKHMRDSADNCYIQALNKLVDDNKKAVVLWDKGWEYSSLELTATKLASKNRKPCVLLTFNEGKGVWQGAACYKAGFNLYALLKRCTKLQALSPNGTCLYVEVTEENLEQFACEFNAICSSLKEEEEKIMCDVRLKLSDIDRNFYDVIELLQPYGVGNPAVKVLLSDMSMKNIVIRAGKHFSASIFDETGICDAVCFDSAFPEVLDNIDMVVTVGLNKYRGKEKIQCQINSLMHNGKSLRKPPVSLVTSYGVRVIDQPIEVLGLTDRKVKQFVNAGIDTVQKLINYLPTKYNDFRYTKVCKDINVPEIGSIIGTVTKVKMTPKITFAMCKDRNGETFMACWFHQDYVARLLSVGYDYIFCGKLAMSDRGLPQVFPMYFSTNIEKYKTIIPEYKKITGMSSEYLIQSIDKALQITPNTDFMDIDIVQKFNMLSDYDATLRLHHPKNDFDIRDGQRRKVFNELFEFNFILKSRNKTNVESKYILRQKDKLDELKSLLTYNLTGDQQRCIDGLYEYMNSGKILNALVQGDVGSGKTMVALFSIVLAINNGYQACLIAPTEVLAQQHYTEISGYLNKLGYTTGYLVGGMKVREKKALLAGLKDGSIQAVVGTHAIIQKDVEFSELAVAVVDEQHKFGVAQREKLANIEGPHMISMSATPIPRTLSMATYGDNIEVYSIKEKPAGRKEVMTLKMFNDNDVNNFMLQQIRQGRQCYVVCPMIEETEVDAMAGVRSVKQEAEAMINWFKNYPEVKISNATGRMKKELIAEEIDKFTRNETNILISTTIIEVGVNVPNATVMVLKSSERFGLAQAHQLRGRVGRGNFQSYCILQTDMDDPKADILCETTDGFEIARQDLLLRGSGDYIGTQQTGNNRNVMLMMSEPELYKGISEVNDEIYKDPSRFAKYSYILEQIEETERKI